jgi:hypothetical protein
VNYAPDASLPGLQYYTGIYFDTLKSDDDLTVIPLKSFRQQVTLPGSGRGAAWLLLLKPAEHEQLQKGTVGGISYE